MKSETSAPMEIYVRHQSGPSALLTFHLSPEQRLQLIAALASGRDVEMSAKLELPLLPQWMANPDDDTPHASIPLHLIAFAVDPARG